MAVTVDRVNSGFTTSFGSGDVNVKSIAVMKTESTTVHGRFTPRHQTDHMLMNFKFEYSLTCYAAKHKKCTGFQCGGNRESV